MNKGIFCSCFFLPCFIRKTAGFGQMSANIQVPEDRDAKITRLEKKVGEMGDMRIGMMDTDRRLKES